jgi:outer membrane receptor protein involved in Fe transport
MMTRCGTAIAAVMMCAAQPAFAQMRAFDLPAQAAVQGIPAFARQAGVQILAPAGGLAGKRTGAIKGRMSVDAALDQLLRGTDLRVVARTGTSISLGADATSPTQPIAKDEGDDGRQSEIVVTGSRIAQLARDTATPVSVVSAADIRLSGAINVEDIFKNSTQFVPSTNGGAYGNVVPGGTADVNLRGFGATRNLVLVNGRRFTISGPEQVTDLNTIPTALIKRTEIVTGGSSAVYGSDAITGVVNFILRDDFHGLELGSTLNLDSPTGTPVYSLDLTVGHNFGGGRGNITLSGNYLERGGITRAERGSFAPQWLVAGCVTADSYDKRGAGTPLAVPGGSTCRGAGGLPGLINSGSGDIPNGRFTGVPVVGSSGSNPALDAALVNAGLGGLGSRGFTFNDAGTIARPALDPQDNYNLQPDNYLIVPQQRWMGNAFAHYDISDRATAYGEFHYSRNKVDQQLAPASIGGNFLVNTNNPYLSGALQQVLTQLDRAERTTSATNRPNDGLASLTMARRLVEVGPRLNSSERNVVRGVAGVRGKLGDVTPGFLRDLSYDAYYSFAQTRQTDRQEGNISRRAFQAGLLSVGGAAPLLNVFGGNLSQAGVDSLLGDATNHAVARQQVAALNLSGTLFELPHGPAAFSMGVEWRKSSARDDPDPFLASGDAVGFPASLPTNGNITAREIYGEVKLPLLADLPMVQRLGVNGAFRYSDYDLKGVGGVWTYLGGVEWRVDDGIALRGQYQRAVRAPNVGELFGGLRQSSEAAVDPCSNYQPTASRTAAVRALCVASGVPAALVFTAPVQPNNLVTATYGGNPAVGVESSDTYTLGTVITPTAIPRLQVSVDYFNITLDGAIAPLGGGLNNTLNLCYNVIQDSSSTFCQAINRNPVTGEISGQYSARILQANTGSLKTSGIDLAARYSMDVGFGLPGLGDRSTIALTTNWTWTRDFTSTPVAAFPNIKNRCVGAFGTTCGEPIPRFRGVTRVTWRTGPLDLSVRGRFIDAVTIDTYLLPKRSGAATTPVLDDLTNPRIRAQQYFDVAFGYDVTSGIKITGGINNVLAHKPPIVVNPRANTYPTTYDALGMGFFLGATAKF